MEASPQSLPAGQDARHSTAGVTRAAAATAGTAARTAWPSREVQQEEQRVIGEGGQISKQEPSRRELQPKCAVKCSHRVLLAMHTALSYAQQQQAQVRKGPSRPGMGSPAAMSQPALPAAAGVGHRPRGFGYGRRHTGRWHPARSGPLQQHMCPESKAMFLFAHTYFEVFVARVGVVLGRRAAPAAPDPHHTTCHLGGGMHVNCRRVGVSQAARSKTRCGRPVTQVPCGGPAFTDGFASLQDKLCAFVWPRYLRLFTATGLHAGADKGSKQSCLSSVCLCFANTRACCALHVVWQFASLLGHAKIACFFPKR